LLRFIRGTGWHDRLRLAQLYYFIKW